MFRIDIPNPIPKILRSLKDGDALIEELEERMYRIERLLLTADEVEIVALKAEIRKEHDSADENGMI